MTLEEAKLRLSELEPTLKGKPFALFHTFPLERRALHVALTERLYRLAKRGRVWKSPAFLTALKNAAYGFDEARARSLGGADGIFLLDRGFTPKNEMMRKIFDRYLDRPGSGVEELASALQASVAQLSAVRVVSHHLRLLGVLWRAPGEDWLILVDYDDTKA
jgi:hypothetical protein